MFTLFQICQVIDLSLSLCKWFRSPSLWVIESARQVSKQWNLKERTKERERESTLQTHILYRYILYVCFVMYKIYVFHCTVNNKKKIISTQQPNR